MKYINYVHLDDNSGHCYRAIISDRAISYPRVSGAKLETIAEAISYGTRWLDRYLRLHSYVSQTRLETEATQ